MALHNDLTNGQLQICIDGINAKYFTTLRVITELERNYPNEIKSLRAKSERNWRSVVGKAIKRYSTETNRIIQISLPEESPARWEKKTE